MKRYVKTLSVVVILALLLSGFPQLAFAGVGESENAVVVSENGENVQVLKEDREDCESLYTLPNQSEVTILNEGTTYTYISFVEPVTGDQVSGYVENSVVLPLNEASQTNEVTMTSVSKESTPPVVESDEQNPPEEPPVDEVDPPVDPTLYGIGLHDPTAVYAEANESAAVLKNYPQGTRLKFEDYNENWYTAIVYMSGVRTQAFIKKADVETIVAEQTTVTGFANRHPLTVFEKASKNSTGLKSYPIGSFLKYKTYTPEWFEATVYLNGKPTRGYIHKDDVGESIPLRGIALESRVNVYSQASTSSSMLKNYIQGTILKYRTYDSNWYEATVYLNGQPTTGYIKKSEVENIDPEQEVLVEVAHFNSVPIYTKASTGADVIKTYRAGSTLKFKTFTSNWYQATVYVNGSPKTGYIHRKTVQGIKGKVIVIDAGHGGKDPGATGTRGTKEKILNLQTANELREMLAAKGATVIMTRTDDTFLELSERVAVSHQYNADLFVSIHYNSSLDSSTRGIETYYWETNVNEKSIAETVQREVVKATGLNNRHARTGNYHVLRENKNPAILVELGYLSNSYEEKTVTSSTYYKKAATGVFNGIVEYFLD